MSKQNLYDSFQKVWKQSAILFLFLATALTVSLVSSPKAQALYILTGVEDSAIVLDGSKSAPAISSKIIDVSTNRSGYDVHLKSRFPVVIHQQGELIHETTGRNETVSSLLKRLKIVPGPLDMVAVDVSDQQVEITVASDLTLYDQVTEPAPYETIRRPNAQMKEGEEKLIQKGEDGVRSSVYEVSWSNGQEISRQFVQELESTAKNEIIEYGTYVEPKAPAAKPVDKGSTENIHSPIAEVKKNPDGSGTLILSTGEQLPFSSVKSMKATAYTTGHDGVGTRTATGTHVHRGTVAVDKRVVPLGTRMYIVTADGSYVYGLGVAEDTGYVGKNLDLYHDTYQQCIQFGRRGVTVYFLE